MQGPLIRCELAQAVQRQRDTFANTDTGEAGEQEGIGKQVVGAAKFLLQPLVIVGIQGPGKIVGLRPEVLAPNQIRLDGVNP